MSGAVDCGVMRRLCLFLGGGERGGAYGCLWFPWMTKSAAVGEPPPRPGWVEAWGLPSTVFDQHLSGRCSHACVQRSG